jgi:small nuclear ribonucleoprotein (snRNP)-like protein
MIEGVYYNCLQCKNKKVRILTADGKEYRGTIVNVDSQNVYLQPEKSNATVRGNIKAKTSAFYPYPGAYANNILTLSLFTLLAIALI